MAIWGRKTFEKYLPFDMKINCLSYYKKFLALVQHYIYDGILNCSTQTYLDTCVSHLIAVNQFLKTETYTLCHGGL